MPQISVNAQVAGAQESLDQMITKWKELVEIRKQMVEWNIETTGIDKVLADIFKVGKIEDSPSKTFANIDRPVN